MVNRIGVAGKLDLPDSADLEVVVADILKRVREVSNSLQGELRERLRAAAGKDTPEPADCRLTSSLAAGADQVVAKIAVQDEIGYSLHAVLPASCAVFRNDVISSVAGLDDGATKATVAGEQFDCLLSKAKAVFELDGDQALSTGGPKRAWPA
jgi:hypothetical protein